MKKALESFPPEYEKLGESLFVKEPKFKDCRYLICYNPEKAKDDRSFRENLIKRVTSELEKLKLMVKKGRLKRRKLILLRAINILASVKGSKKYFSISSEEDRKSTFQIKQEVLAAEETPDGIHILKTNCQDHSFKELSQVEDAFRETKGFLKD